MQVERDERLESDLETAKMAMYGVFWLSAFTTLIAGRIWFGQMGMPNWGAWPTAALVSFIVSLMLFGLVRNLPPVEALWQYTKQRGEDHNPLAFELFFVFARNCVLVGVFFNSLYTKSNASVFSRFWYIPLLLFIILIALNSVLRLASLRR